MKLRRKAVDTGRHYRSRSRGQTLTLAAMLMPVIIGFGALATDVAVYYVNWFAMQKGVDSAVLSGASYLPNYTSQAISTADTYANNNGIQSGEIVSVTVGSNNTSLSMTAKRTIAFYFARVFGIDNGTVQVHATAAITNTGAAEGAVPIGVDYRTDYQFGTPITLHPPGMTPGPGNWEPLVLGSDPGTSALINNIENGYSGELTVNQMITTQTGDDPHNIQQAINYRINEGMQIDPSGTFSDHSLNDPRVMLIPMVNFAGVNGSSQVPLMGFAQVWVNSASGDGSISTTFIQETAASSQPNPSVQGFGTYTPILIE